MPGAQNCWKRKFRDGWRRSQPARKGLRSVCLSVCLERSQEDGRVMKKIKITKNEARTSELLLHVVHPGPDLACSGSSETEGNVLSHNISISLSLNSTAATQTESLDQGRQIEGHCRVLYFADDSRSPNQTWSLIIPLSLLISIRKYTIDRKILAGWTRNETQ